MNADHLLNELLRSARDHAPETGRAELGFETRLIARLREERDSSWRVWSWRLCPYFATLALAAAAWCYTRTDFEPDAETFLSVVSDGGRAALLWFSEGES